VAIVMSIISLIGLGVACLWFFSNKEYEPFLAILGSFSGLITSLSATSIPSIGGMRCHRIDQVRMQVIWCAFFLLVLFVGCFYTIDFDRLNAKYNAVISIKYNFYFLGIAFPYFYYKVGPFNGIEPVETSSMRDGRRRNLSMPRRVMTEESVMSILLKGLLNPPFTAWLFVQVIVQKLNHR